MKCLTNNFLIGKFSLQNWSAQAIFFKGDKSSPLICTMLDLGLEASVQEAYGPISDCEGVD